MTKEELMKLQTYKMFEDEEAVYVDRNDVLELLEQESCEDCVSRAELKKWLDMNFSFGGASRKFELFDRLDKELPPVTPKQKTGHWRIVPYEETMFCSECNCRLNDEQTYLPLNYCPNCGAKMVESQESEDKE